MMVTCQVFGKIAGSSAAEYAISQAAIRTTGEEAVCQMTDDPQYQRIMELLHKAIDSKALLKRLRIAAQDHLLVGRNEEGLTSLLNTVNELKRELMTAPAGQNANLANIDFYHMLITVGIMAESALQRKESRGSHHRSDFPQTDPKYGSPIIIKK